MKEAEQKAKSVVAQRETNEEMFKKKEVETKAKL